MNINNPYESLRYDYVEDRRTSSELTQVDGADKLVADQADKNAPYATVGSAEGQPAYKGLRDDPNADKVRDALDTEYNRLIKLAKERG